MIVHDKYVTKNVKIVLLEKSSKFYVVGDGLGDKFRSLAYGSMSSARVKFETEVDKFLDKEIDYYMKVADLKGDV